MKNDLQAIRAEIDRVDDELVALFVERMQLVQRVASEKKQSGKAIADGAREQAVIERLTAGVDGEWKSSVKALYDAVFQISKAYQKSLLSGEKQ